MRVMRRQVSVGFNTVNEKFTYRRESARRDATLHNI